MDDSTVGVNRTGRWRRILLAVLAVLVLGGVVFWAVIWRNRGADEASTEDVLDRFRRQNGTTEAAAELLRPAPGVYSYRAEGDEGLSFLDTRQNWGPTMPATVTRGEDGCWNLRLEYSTLHWREFRYCTDRRSLDEVGGTIYQGFDFGVVVGETTEFVCDPPVPSVRLDAKEGDHWDARCTGETQAQKTNVVSAGTNTFVGPEKIEIGGEKVAALHYRQDRTLTGAQTGDEVTEYWYAARDGMMLKCVHRATVVSPSPLGDITFTADGSFQLSSLEPIR